jgi:hypothetical protein
MIFSRFSQADLDALHLAKYMPQVHFTMRVGITSKLVSDYIAASSWTKWADVLWPHWLAAEGQWSHEGPCFASLTLALREKEPSNARIALHSMASVCHNTAMQHQH